MRIEATSDLHGQMPRLKGADLLAITGDIGWNGHPNEIEPYISWMGAQPHKYKLFVPGNHDRCIETSRELFKKKFAEVGVTMLIDEAITIEKIKFYGYPHTVPYKNWSFMPHEKKRERLVKRIPKCDVLLAHGPPHGIMDESIHEEIFFVPHENLVRHRKEMVNTGCAFMARHLALIKPQVMIFGHIHHQHGFEEHFGTRYYNVAWPGTHETVMIEVEDKPLTLDDF